MTELQGWTAKGFEGVRDAFTRNFDEGNEVGAAFSAYHRGQKVVDLWGGIADAHSGRAWEEDSIVLVFSTTKGLTAVCANKLAQEGRLDVDAPVASTGPSSAQAGKEDDPGALAAVAPGRPARRRRAADARATRSRGTRSIERARARRRRCGSPGRSTATTRSRTAGSSARSSAASPAAASARTSARRSATRSGSTSGSGCPRAEEPRVAQLVGWVRCDGALIDDAEFDEATRAIARADHGPRLDARQGADAPGGALAGHDVFEQPARCAPRRSRPPTASPTRGRSPRLYAVVHRRGRRRPAARPRSR